MFDLKAYTPAGPKIAAFHASDAFHRLIAGPIGSSKTTAAGVAEAFITAMMQRPDVDGIRRAKVGVLRDTYRNIYATLIPTWHFWVPREFGHFVGSDDRPARHDLSFPAPLLDKFGQPTLSQGMCELSVEFRALGTHSAETVCRGWELMGAYQDEEDMQPPEARSFLAGRVMRGGDIRYRVSRGVWGTFNKPDTDHPLYTTCVEDLPEGYAFFDQPGGLLPGGPPYVPNPLAENAGNLDPEYYIKSATGQPEWYVRRMIRNLWGASISGSPVYPQFDPDRHVSPVEIEPAPMSELVLGLDGGGTPAAVIGGRQPNGRRFTYAEVVVVDPSDPRGRRIAHGVGAKRFAEQIGDTLLPRFRNCTVSLGYGDPAAFYGADRENGEYSFMETVGHILKIPVIPAPSNETGLRMGALLQLMTRANHSDNMPDWMCNPSCRFLRRGMGGDFKWDKVDPLLPGKALKRQKTASSHVCEANEYLALGDIGRAGVTAGPAFDRFQPKREDPVAGGLWRAHEIRVSQRPDTSLSPQQRSYDADFNLWRS